MTMIDVSSAPLDPAPAHPDEVHELTRRGSFIRRDFFSPDEMDALEAQADAAVTWRNEGMAGYDDLFSRISTQDGFVFVNELYDDSPVRGGLRDFCMQPRIRDMARALGGPGVAHCCYQLVYKFAGHDRSFAWHQDEINTPSDPPFFNMWIALNDMDVENGCLWTLPGVGLDGVLPHTVTPEGLCAWPMDDPDQGEPLLMRRGDICMMSSRALHKSGGNASGRDRKAMLIIFMDENARVHGQTVPTVAYG